MNHSRLNMNKKWKRKWLLSLVLTFSMVFSTVGSAATSLTAPTAAVDPNTDTELASDKNTESNSENETILDSKDENDTSSEDNTDLNTENEYDSDSKDENDSNSDSKNEDDSNSDGENSEDETGSDSENNPDADSEDKDDEDSEDKDHSDSENKDDKDSKDEDESNSDSENDDASDSKDNANTDSENKADSDTADNVDSDSKNEVNPDSEDDTNSDSKDENDADSEDKNNSDSQDEISKDDLLENPADEPSAPPVNPDNELSADLKSDTCDHSWSQDWSYDENRHWHECGNKDCPITDNSEKDGYGKHTYNEDNECSICGYIDPESVSQLSKTAGAVLSYDKVYDAMIALEKNYPEGMEWTNFKPYGSKGDLGSAYRWNGGKIFGASSGVGCSAFAFILSDEAFGNLPARAITRGNFTFEDVKVGDILRVNNNSHSVIVLKKSAGGVIVAEANYNKSVHWGRAISKSEVLAADHIITRYPTGYVSPDNPEGEKEVQHGTAGNLKWSLTNTGVLTISGSGIIPDYDVDPAPWKEYSFNTVVIDKGVTGIGSYAFYQSNELLSIYIPDGVKKIGESAFEKSGLISVTLPGSVEGIGNDAFHSCANLTSVTVSEGVKIIGERAFQGCTSLAYIDFPTSITSVGAGAFMSCTEMTRVRFMPGTGTVTMGDNLFSQCQRLTSVTLPKTTDRISAGMFSSCTLLPVLYIPASVTAIGKIMEESPFNSCGNLKHINFGGSEAAWKKMMNPQLEASLTSIKANVNFNVSFDDPFAPIPNDPGDLPDKDGSETNPDGSGTNPDDSNNGHKHNWSSTWTYDAASHWHECDDDCSISNNRDKDGFGSHSYGSWIIDVSATTSQSGSRHRDCGVCQYRQTSYIPATGSSGGSGNNSGNSNYNSDSSSYNSDNSSNTPDQVKKTSTTLYTTIKRLPDGSNITTKTQDDGTIITNTRDASGNMAIGVNLSVSAISTAQQTGEVVSLPISAVTPARNTADAPAITVSTGGVPAKVAIPVSSPSAGTVAVIIREDGSSQLITNSALTADGISAVLPDGATVKIVDNSKSFADVPAGSPFEHAVAFVSARELFHNTEETVFAPDAPMTNAMLFTALARLDGAETDIGTEANTGADANTSNNAAEINNGTAWYTKGMEWAAARGMNAGINPDGAILCEELITTLWNYMGSPVASGIPSDSTDNANALTGNTQVSSSQTAMLWAMNNGIVSGFEDGSLNPQGQITRAQAAQIIMNLINYPYSLTVPHTQN